MDAYQNRQWAPISILVMLLIVAAIDHVGMQLHPEGLAAAIERFR